MKHLTEKEVNKLPIGTILYYEEYSVPLERLVWKDVVKISERRKYSSPLIKVVFGMLNDIGDEARADTFEISNGRAKAITDKHYIIKIIWDW